MQEHHHIVPALLKTHEAAELCNIGERTLWRWSRSGIAPPPVKINGTVRYRRDVYQKWIDAGCPHWDTWDSTVASPTTAV